MAGALMLGAMGAQAAGVVTFSVHNDAPVNGMWIMRPWVGISDGNFTTYTVGSAATTGVKHEAEDGVTGSGNGGDVNPTPPNTCSGAVGAYTGSDCLFQQFSAYGNGYSQTSIGNPTAPNATISGTLAADELNPNGGRLSYLIMAIPTNDTFFGTATASSLSLFDGSGNFNGGNGNIVIHVFASDLLDAGTEINDECNVNGNDVAFLCQGTPGTGRAENGLVHAQSAFGTGISGRTGPAGFGSPAFTAINDGFTNPGNSIATITISFVATPEPATFVLFGLSAGALALVQARRKRNA
jgi:hypothetical protein